MIASIGWGSLIWDPDGLPVNGIWHPNGPPIQLEFARQSSRGRATLVITETADPMTTLWSQMTTEDLHSARDTLKTREGTALRLIASQHRDEMPGASPTHVGVHKWLQAMPITAAIWTAIPPKWDQNIGRVPSEFEVVDYLRSRHGNEAAAAEEYVRRAPNQIRTRYRAAIERELAWTPRDE